MSIVSSNSECLHVRVRRLPCSFSYSNLTKFVKIFQTKMRVLNYFKYDKLKSRFQKFCDDTTLDGFKEMFYAKAQAWTVIWFVVVFGAIGVTIFQVYKAILQYMQQSSVTQVTPIDPDGLMYPPLYVCYPHWIYWVDWTKAYSMNFTKESILYALSFTTTIFSENKFNITEAKVNLTNSMAANGIRTLTELLSTIAITLPMMTVYDGVTTPRLMENIPFFTKKLLVWKTRSYFMCYTIDGDEILKVLHNSSSQSTRGLQTYFNFSILDPDYSLYASHVTYNEYNYNMAHWLCKNTNYWFSSVSDFLKNYTDFTLPLQIFPDAYSDSSVEIITDIDSYIISMTPSVHRWKSSDGAPCQVGEKAVTSNTSCQLRCGAIADNALNSCMFVDEAALMGGLDDQIDKLCASAINFLENAQRGDVNATDPCNHFPNASKNFIDELTLTVPLETWTYQYGNCCAGCKETCEVWKYTFVVATDTISGVVKQYTYKNQTDIKIMYPEFGDVMITIQSDAQTWEDFVGNVGGLLGVWTGASILSLLQLFYLCCFIENSCTCFHKYILRKPMVDNVKVASFVKTNEVLQEPTEVIQEERKKQILDDFEEKAGEVNGDTIKKFVKENSPTLHTQDTVKHMHVENL